MRKFAVAVLSACLLALIVLSAPLPSSAQVAISVAFGPPALPVYEQPVCPEDGYIWTPGYWAWDPDEQDYYWVPGTWVPAPEVGYLWTPPWWGWENGAFLFHVGFWGPHIGWYGGINYGFGYFGEGFVGGRWDGGHFFYNRDVANINVVNIHNVYNEHVTVVENHVSYNGGQGGITARPRPEDLAADRDRHIGPVAAQEQHVREAQSNRELRASVNQGRPPIAATARAGDFRTSATPARQAGAPYHAPAPAERAAAGRPGQPAGNARPENNARPAVHPNDLPAAERPAPPNTGNAKQDQKYQQQQNKLYAKQQQQRQQLQQKQEQEHQRADQQKASDAQRQQMEQRHQQQTQHLQQQHTQQQQHLQQRQAPPPKEQRK